MEKRGKCRQYVIFVCVQRDCLTLFVELWICNGNVEKNLKNINTNMCTKRVYMRSNVIRGCTRENYVIWVGGSCRCYFSKTWFDCWCEKWNMSSGMQYYIWYIWKTKYLKVFQDVIKRFYQIKLRFGWRLWIISKVL